MFTIGLSNPAVASYISNINFEGSNVYNVLQQQLTNIISFNNNAGNYGGINNDTHNNGQNVSTIQEQTNGNSESDVSGRESNVSTLDRGTNETANETTSSSTSSTTEQSIQGLTDTVNSLKVSKPAKELFNYLIGLVKGNNPNLTVAMDDISDKHHAEYNSLNQIVLNNKVFTTNELVISDEAKLQAINHELIHALTETGLSKDTKLSKI